MSRRKGTKQGKLARSLFRLPGDDLEADWGTAENRLGIIDDTETGLIASITGGAVVRLAALVARIGKFEQWLTDRADERKRKEAVLAARIEQAAAWRATGIQERYTTTELRPAARAMILVLLAMLDFYIFAQAYAFVDDVPDFSVQWWLGGLLGLTVFGAGLTLSRQLKALVVSRRQVEFREERKSIDAELVELGVSLPAIIASALFFVLLCAAGLVVRVEGSSQQDIGVLLLQTMIPLLVVVVEVYLYDPLQRRGPGENIIDRLLRARVNALKHRHDQMIDALEHYLAGVRASMEIERRIARAIASDKGMRLRAADASPTTLIRGTSNGASPVPSTGMGAR